MIRDYYNIDVINLMVIYSGWSEKSDFGEKNFNPKILKPKNKKTIAKIINVCAPQLNNLISLSPHLSQFKPQSY